jgi:hypothetical protein
MLRADALIALTLCLLLRRRLQLRRRLWRLWRRRRRTAADIH